MANTFKKSALILPALLCVVSLHAQAQPQAPKNALSNITLVDAMGDSLLRSYSVDELLRYKNYYEEERAQLEKERNTLREKGIVDLETFLQNHPESKVLDKVVFRLAELYYEQAESEYLAAQEKYGEALDQHDAGELAELPEEPKKDFSRTLTLYQKVIDDYARSPLQDDARYGIAFISEEMQKRDEAVALYEKFVEEFPDSPYIPDVLMRQAEYYFNPPQNQSEKAIEIYQKILSYTESPKYNEALYKLGWSAYKLNDYPKAISYFTMLADDIGQARQFDPSNKISNPALREEAVEYIGISFLDYTGVNGAEQYFAEIGGRDYGVRVLRKIGDSYMDVKEEYDNAIAAYEVLLKLYPYAPEAPLVQARVAEAYRFLEDDQQTYLMRKKLFATYHEGTDWWNAVEDKAAREKALQLAEHALRANINLLLDAANQTGNPNLFAQAVDDTKEYLKVFPEDSSAVRLHWNMALTLDAKLQRDEDAYTQYMDISNLYWGSKFQKESAKNAIAIAQDFVKSDSLQRAEVLPVNIGDLREQVEQGEPDLRKNLKLEKIPLSDGETKLAAAIDNFIKLFPYDDDAPDRLSQAGSIYYNTNDFINSLKYFKTLLKHFPNDSLAEDAEFLVMESYFGNLDFQSVEIVAKRLLSKDVRSDYVAKASRRLAEAIFLQAQSLADAKEHFKAAEEYSRVAEEVPNAEFADLALFNAGLEYDQAREYSRAVETYDRMTQNYPKSKHYLPALNNMALDYRELRDFRNAAIVFERLSEEETDEAKIETHLYNASVSFVDAEDWDRAIRVNKKFVDKYPGSEDADDMFYDVANYYLKLSDFKKANEIYGEYAEKFPDSPRVVETYFRRGEYYLKNNQPEVAKSEFELAINKSDDFVKAEKDGNPFFAAEALFHLTELKLKDFQGIAFKLPSDSMQASKDRKKAMLLDIVESYSKVSSYATIRLYEATYKIGIAYENFAETWAAQEIPETTEEKRIVARKEINETATELFERTVGAFKNSLEVLTRIADQYNKSFIEPAGKDTSAQASDKIVVADTTLLVANRWIERSKEKISENIYDIAEINSTSVQGLLDAPVPIGMDKVTEIEFRNQLLGSFIAPIVKQIVDSHVRNLNESRELGLENRWVEQSRNKVITTNKILADEYNKLAWEAINGYAGKISEYTEKLPTDDVMAFGLADEMSNFIDFARTHGNTAISAYNKTISKAKQESIHNNELLKAENEFLAFVYEFSAHADSLAKVANAYRKNFELQYKKTKERFYEDGLYTFEDNYLSLSDGKKEFLKRGYELSQALDFENEYSEKIIQALVKSDPEKYAGVLGLEVSEIKVVTDASWRGATEAGENWQNISFNDSLWRQPYFIDSTAAFSAYDAKRIWLSNETMQKNSILDSTSAGVAETQIDSSQASDSLAVALTDSISKALPEVQDTPAETIYLRKTIDIKGLPVAGQIQIRADDTYKLYFNEEFISEVSNPADFLETHIHDFTDFLRPGKNVISLQIDDADQTGRGVEALIFLKNVPGWEKRQAEIAAQKAREAENLLFDKGKIMK